VERGAAPPHALFPLAVDASTVGCGSCCRPPAATRGDCPEPPPPPAPRCVALRRGWGCVLADPHTPVRRVIYRRWGLARPPHRGGCAA